MHTITIEGKDYTLTYGFEFIRELDKRYAVSDGSVSFGFGVQHAVVDLQQKNPVILLDIIQAATITERQKPSVKGIEAYVIEEAENDRLDSLFDDFLSELRTQPLTKATVKRVEEATE
ncbi:MAG: tail assembly chaperone [Streptococcus thermophilus]|uniref:tail assembly chaperone n=1 Tax=Streptococcus sp. FSL L8-0526 TaxID=2954690 RepID=UPI0030F4EA05